MHVKQLSLMLQTAITSDDENYLLASRVVLLVAVLKLIPITIMYGA